MGFRAGAVLLCAAVLATVAIGPAYAAFPGQNGKIAFYDSGVVTINPDGSGRTALALPTDHARAPAWSPDGAKLASARVDGVQVSNPDGSGVQTVFDLATSIESIDWSPDGLQLAAWDYVIDSAEGDSAAIYVFNATGAFPRVLVDPGAFAGRLSWSPIGDRIAFDGFFGGVTGIYTIKPDGTGLQLVTTGARGPDFSPDGSKLVATRGGDVVVMNADGSGETQLTAGPAFDSEPAWSPDGTKIIFASNRSPAGLYVVDAIGGTPAFLTPSGTGADWQPIPVVATPAKNRSHACKAERQRLGAAEFASRYGGGASAHGKCVSGAR